MRRHQAVRVLQQYQALILVVIVIAASASGAWGQNRVTKQVDKTAAARALPLLPMTFEENQGQADSRVRFLSRGPGYTLFLTGDESVLTLSNGHKQDSLRLSYDHSNRAPRMEGADREALKSFYYIGNDPAKWQKNVPNFGRVQYHQLYPGVDLSFYGSQGKLENDFVIAAGADAARVQLKVDGAQKTYVDSQGNLVMATASGDVRLLKPRAYQTINGQQHEVAAEYRVAKNRVTFALGAYDRSRELVIDPVIDYMTYVTEAAAVTVKGVAVNSNGNTFILGSSAVNTFSPAPTQTYNSLCGASGTTACTGSQSFVLELSADSATATPSTAGPAGVNAVELVFFGGTSTDTPNGIAVGSTGNVYVTGTTTSTDFPIAASGADSQADFTPPQKTNAGSSDVFIFKLDPTSGNILYSTYLGGTGAETGNAIAVVTPNALVTGSTQTNNIFNVNGKDTTLSGTQNAFVEVLNTEVAGDITGASCSSTNDSTTLTFGSAHNFAVGDRVRVVGVATGGSGTNFNDGTTTETITFVAADLKSIKYTLQTGAKCKGNPDTSAGGGTVTGRTKYSTYLGAGTETGNAIAATALTNIAITGNTSSSTFPKSDSSSYGGNGDAFAAAYDATQSGASSLLYATFVGGAQADTGDAIAIDGSGNAYVVGTTASTETTSKLCKSNNPGATCKLQTSNAGGKDAFIYKVNSSGTLQWSTYLGGSGDEQAKAAAIDTTNNLLYVGGSTKSSNLFSGASAHAGSLSGLQDGFVAIIGGINSGTQTFPEGFYLGGLSNLDSIAGLALDSNHSLYFAGNTNSLDLVSQQVGTTASAYQPISRFTVDQTQLSSTQLGYAGRLEYSPATASVLGAAESRSNQTSSVTGDNVFYCASCSAGSQTATIRYSYAVTVGTATATDVVFNWPAPRSGGTIAAILGDAGGTGYTNASAVTITGANGSGSGATATVTTSGGAITSFNVTNAGSGYQSPVVISVAGGTGAAAHALVTPGTAYFTVGNAQAVTGGTCTVAGTEGTGANPDGSGAKPGITCVFPSLTTSATPTITFDATTTTAAQATTAAITFAPAPTIAAANGTVTAATNVGTITSLPIADLQVTQGTPKDGGGGAVTDVDVTTQAALTNANRVVYSVVVTNLGPGGEPAGMALDVKLPLGYKLDNTTPVAYSPNNVNWGSCATTPDGVNANILHYQCTSGSPLASGGGNAETITITGYFDTTVSQPSSPASVTESASVTSAATAIDPVSTNNTNIASTSVNVHRKAYLDDSVVVQVPDPNNAGQFLTNDGSDTAHTGAVGSTPLRYTTTVNNKPLNGTTDSDAATNVLVTYLFPTANFTVGANDYPTGTPVANPANASQMIAGCAIDSTNSRQVLCSVGPMAGSVAQVATTATYHLTVTSGSDWNAKPASNNTADTVVTISSVSVENQNNVPDVTASAHLARFADLSATLTDSSTTATAPAALTDGTKPITLVATISNAAISGNDSDATNSKLDFTLNDGQAAAAPGVDATKQLVSADGTCTEDGADYHIIHCTITKNSGTVTAGATTFTFTLKYTAGVNSPLLASTAKSTSLTTTVKVFSNDVFDDGALGAPGTNNTSSAATSYLARLANLAMVLSDNTQVTAVPLADNTKPIILSAALTNNGPDPANNIQVSFNLQQNQQAVALTKGYTVSATTFPGGCTPAVAAAPPQASLSIVCTVTGSLAKYDGTPGDATNPTYTVSILPDSDDATSNWLSKTAVGGTGYITSNAEVSSTSVWDDGLAGGTTPDGSPGLDNVSPLASASPNVLHSNLQRTTDLQVTAFADINNYPTFGANGAATSTSNRLPLAGTLTYTVTVQNNGPDTAEGTKVLIPIPTIATNPAPTIVANPGAQTAFPGVAGCTVDSVNSQLVCYIDELTKAAGAKTYAVSITPNEGWTSVAPTSNFATSGTASADFAADPNGANNAQNTTSYFERLADLQLTSTSTPNSSATAAANLTGTTSSGTPLTFNATVTNAGPDSATGINVIFTLPGAGYSNISTPASNSGVTCAIGSNTSTVDCTVPTMASAAATSFQFSVTPDPTWLAATKSNDTFNVITTASSAQVVDDGASGAAGANNTQGTLAAWIQRLADLQFATFSESSHLQSGGFMGVDDTLVMTATVKNAGPDTINFGGTNNIVPVTFKFSTATNAGATYNLANVTKITGTTTFSSCDAPVITGTDGKVTCYITDAMAKNAQNTYAISLSPDPTWAGGSVPSYEGTVADDATVSSANVVDDGASGAAGTNNNATQTTTYVARKADLAISTHVTDSSTTATTPTSLTGGNKTITLSATVTNNGPDDVGSNPFNVVFVLTPAQASPSFAGMTITPGTNLSGCAAPVTTATQATITCTTSAQPTKPTGTNPSYTYSIGVVADPSWVPASGSKGLGSFTSSAHISQGVVLDAVSTNDATEPAGNTTPTSSYVARTSDLVLSSLTDNTQPLVYQPLTGTVTYTANAKNNGPDTTTSDVQVKFTMPTANYALSGGGSGNPVGFTGCSKSGVTITCNYSSTLASGASTGNLQVSVTPDDAWVGTGTNGLASQPITAEVSSASVWDNGTSPSAGSPKSSPLGDNDLQVNTNVERLADIQVTTPFTDGTSAASPAPLTPALNMSTTIANAGPDPAKTVVLTYTLPTTGYTFTGDTLSAQVAGAACSQTAGTNLVKCTIPTLAKSSVSFVLNVTPDGSATNVPTTGYTPATTQITTAAISSVDIVDSDPSTLSNQKTLTSTLQRQSDLSLGDMSDNGPISISGVNTLGQGWTVTTPVSNNGPDSSPNTAVVFTFPNTWTATSWSLTSATFPGGCSVGATAGLAAYQMRCVVGTLNKNTTTSYSFTVSPDTSVIGTAQTATYVNNAQITTYNAGTTACCTVDASSAPGSNADTTGRITTPKPLTTTISRIADMRIVGQTDQLPSNPGTPTSATNPVSLSGTLQLVTRLQNVTGPDSAAGVTVTYTFPSSGFTVVGNTFGLGGTLDAGTCGKAGNIVTCQYDRVNGGILAVSGTATAVTLSVIPDPAWVGVNQKFNTLTSTPISATVSGTFLNKATGGQITATDAPTIGRIANLQITNESDETGTGSLTPGTTSSPTNPQPLSTVSNPSALTLDTTIQNVSGDPVTGFSAVYTFTSTTTASGFGLVSNTWGVNGVNDPTACVLNTSAHTVTCTYAGLLATGATQHFLLSVTPDSTWVGSTQTTASEPVTVSFVPASTYAGTPYNTAVTNLSNAFTSTIGRVSNLQITSETDMTPATAKTPNAVSSISNPVPLAGPLTLKTTLTNAGPNAATGFKVQYGFTSSGYVIAGKSGYDSCVVNGSDATKVDCSVTTTQLAVSTPTTYALAVTPDPAWVTTAQQVNTETVTATLQYSLNSAPSGTSASFDSTIGRVAVLQINSETDATGANSKSPGNPTSLSNPAPLAGPLTVATQVKNSGPDAATGFTVTYTFETAGYTLIPGTAVNYTSCAVNGSNSLQVICTAPLQANGGSLTTYSVSITPDPSWVLTTEQTHSRLVSAAIGYAYNTAASATSVTTSSVIGRVGDVEIFSQTDAAPNNLATTNTNPAPLAGPLTLVTNVKNNGPDAIDGFTVVYTLPSVNGDYALFTTSSFTGFSACTRTNSTTLTCSAAGLQPAGTTVPYTVSIKPDTGWIANGQQLQQQLITSALTYGVNLASSNLSGSVNSWLGRVSNVQITAVGDAIGTAAGAATSSTNPVALSGTLVLTTDLHNGGPDAVANAVVTYTMPTANYTLLSDTYVNAGQGGCVKNTTTITCTVATLAVNSAGSTRYTVSLTPDPAWVPSNQSTMAEPIPVALNYPLNSASTNLTGTITSTIGRIADLQITMTDNSTAISGLGTVVPLAGPLTYTANVKNAGPDNISIDPLVVADAVKVTFTLPNANYAIKSNTFAGTAGCQQSGATIVCSVGNSISSGVTVSPSVTVTPDPSLTNSTVAHTTATLASSQVFEPGGTPAGNGGTNNNTFVDTTLARMTHLSIDPITTPTLANPATDFVQLGQPMTYVFKVRNAATTNGGQTTSAAAGVTADVVLPTAFTNASTTSTGWACNFANHPSCTFSGTILPDGANGVADQSSSLVISGTYTDDTTVMHLTGGGTYNSGANTYAIGQGNGGTLSATPGTTQSANADSLNAVSTSTNVQRNSQFTVAEQISTPAPPTAANLGSGSPVAYTFQVQNADLCGVVGCNTADGVTLSLTFPNGFQYSNFKSATNTWSCPLTLGAGNTLTCTVSPVQRSKFSEELVITGYYDAGMNLSSGGALTVAVTGNLTATATNNLASVSTTISTNTLLHRSVDLGVAISAPSVVGGAAVLGQLGGDPTANTATYTVTVTNSGANDASGGTTSDPNAVILTFLVDGQGTTPGLLASHFNTTGVTVSGNTVPVNCDTSTAGKVVCNYAKQAAGSTTTFTINGQFDGSVALAGSANASASANIASSDSFDGSSANNTAAALVTVVDTPVSGATLGGTSPVTFTSTGKPITVTFSNVTVPGVITQSVATAAPAGFVEPANTTRNGVVTASYSTTSPQYDLVNTDGNFPITYSGPVTVCVAINAASYANPARVRIFDRKGADITTSLSTTKVCGVTFTVPNAFTVREAVPHAPTATMAQPTQVLSGGTHTGGSGNQFTISAAGTTDADQFQICNGTDPASVNAQFCGDTLTYVFIGPVGMGSGQPGNWSPDLSTLTVVVPPNADGSLGAPPFFLGAFPSGSTQVAMTVTDQTGRSATATVTVNLANFTLGSTTTTSATISAGQSTNFSFSPTSSVNGITIPTSFTGLMSLSCTGKKDSNGSTLAQNGMTCTMSPSQITQGQSSSVLISSSGPNFSMNHPALPGSHRNGGMLGVMFAMLTFPAFGIVLLPGERRKKGLMLAMLLIVALVMFQTACGGGATQPVTQTVSAATPTGTYTITVTGTANGGVVSTSTFHVTVQ